MPAVSFDPPHTPWRHPHVLDEEMEAQIREVNYARSHGWTGFGKAGLSPDILPDRLQLKLALPRSELQELLL